MPHEFKEVRRVEFSDTDMAGIVHFANFFRYMEATEHAFFRSLGHTLHTRVDGAMRGWARVHAECDYERPLRYPEPFEVHLSVVDKTVSTLTYGFVFRAAREDGGPFDRDVARGSVTVVCVTRDADGGRMRSVPMPDEIASVIEPAPS